VWVGGAEADINYIGRHRNRSLGSTSFVVGPNTAGVQPGTYTVAGFTNNNDTGDWFATVRARLGFAFDRWMVYGTGGAAFHDPGSETLVSVTGPTGATATYAPSGGDRVGWAAGVGGEYAIMDNVTVGVEYLHLGFNRSQLVEPVLSTINGQTLVDIRQDVDLVRARLNFKFGSLFGL
jgi:outer membrane immunogenic protein